MGIRKEMAEHAPNGWNVRWHRNGAIVKVGAGGDSVIKIIVTAFRVPSRECL